MEFIFWILICLILVFLFLFHDFYKKCKIKDNQIKTLENDLNNERNQNSDIYYINENHFDELCSLKKDYHNLITKNNKLITENYLLKKEINDRTGFKYNNKTF